MASYTDSPQILGNFSPYIQQLPVSQMVEVGMQKQNQYNQGIERIQASIDSVAGLDVIRDVDKKYLQSKMDELGNNLKSVAAGDFSNFQLVNSTAGMVGSIAKDKNVINAVGSTNNHRKQVANIEKAKEKGEWGVENEVDYQKQFSKYLSSDQIGEVFNGQYTPYTDVNKKLIDVAKAVGVDESIVQELFKTDSKGNWELDKNNLPQFNTVMVEKHLKGKDPAKLLEAFQNALTPQDYNQLSITGRYFNGNKSPEVLGQEIQSNYTQQISYTEAKINELKINLKNEKEKTSPKMEVMTSLNNSILLYEKQKSKLETSLKDDIQKVMSDPDSVRANLYINKYITGMSRSLSEMSETTETKSSPIFEADMKLKQFDLEQQKFRVQNDHWNKDYSLSVRKQLWEEQKDKDENTEKPTTGVDMGVGTSGITPTSVMNTRKEDFSRKLGRKEEIDRTLAIESYKGIVERKAEDNNDSYNQRVMQRIEADAKAKGLSTEAFISKRAIDKVVNSANNPVFSDILKERRALDKELYSSKILIENRQKRAIEEAKKRGLNTAEYSDIMKGINPVSIDIQGRNFTIPKEDIHRFVKAYPERFNVFGKLSTSIEEEKEANEQKSYLSKKYGDLLPSLEKGLLYVETENYEGSGIISPNIELINLSQRLRKRDNEEIAKIEADYYKNDDLFQGKSFEIKKDKDNPTDYTNRIMNVVRSMSGVTNYNVGDLQTILDDSKSAIVNVLPSGDSTSPFSYSLSILPAKGEELIIPITADKFSYLTGNSPVQSNTKPKVFELLDEYGNTSLNGNNSADMAWWDENDFTSLQGSEYSAKGNLVAVAGSSDKFLFQVYLNGSNTPITIGEPLSKWAKDERGQDLNGVYNPQIENLPQMVNEAFIEQLLLQYNKNN